METNDFKEKIAKLKETKKILQEELSALRESLKEKRALYKDEFDYIKLLKKDKEKLEKKGKKLSKQDAKELKELEKKVKVIDEINDKIKRQGKLIEVNLKTQKKVTEAEKKRIKLLEESEKKQQKVLEVDKKRLEKSEKLLENTKKQTIQSNLVNKSLQNLGKALEKNQELNTQFIEAFGAQEKQLGIINTVLEKRGDITDKELANIQKFAKAQTAYQRSIADISTDIAKGKMNAEQGAEATKRLTKEFSSMAKSLEFTSKQGKAVEEAIEGANNSADLFGKSLEKVYKRTADIKHGFDEIKGQLGSIIPMGKELSNVFGKFGKVGFAGALAALGAAAGKFLNESGLLKKMLPGIEDKLDIEQKAKIREFEEITQPLARDEFDIDQKFAKEKFDLDQKYEIKRHKLTMDNKQAEAAMTFKSEASMAYFGKALPNLSYAANQLQNAGLSAETIANASVSIASNMGVGGKESVKLGADMAVFAKFAGIGAEEAGSITESFKLLDGVTANTAANMMQGVKAMAEQLDLNPGAIMKEMASASEIALEMNINSGKALAKQVAYASSLGVSFSKIAKAGQNMVLNYKDSIKSEMELSALLGRQIDLSEVRMKFAEGDTTGALQALQAQGLDPSQMDIFQKQALQQTLGMDISDLSKIAKGKGKDTEALDNAASKIDKASIDVANKIFLAGETFRQIKLDNQIFENQQRLARKELEIKLQQDREDFEIRLREEREKLEADLNYDRLRQELQLKTQLESLQNTIITQLVPALLFFGAGGGPSALRDFFSKLRGKGGMPNLNGPSFDPKSTPPMQNTTSAPKPAMVGPTARKFGEPLNNKQKMLEQVRQLREANPGMPMGEALKQIKSTPTIPQEVAQVQKTNPGMSAKKAYKKISSEARAASRPSAPTKTSAPPVSAKPKIPTTSPITQPKMSFLDKLNPKKFLGNVIKQRGGLLKVFGSLTSKLLTPLGTLIAGFGMFQELSAMVKMNQGPLPDLYKYVGSSVMGLVGSTLGGIVGSVFLGPLGAILGSTLGSTVFGFLGNLVPGIPTILGEFLVENLKLFGKPGSAVTAATSGEGEASVPTAAETTSKASAIIGTTQAVKSVTASPLFMGGAPKYTPASVSVGSGVKTTTPGAIGTSTTGSAIAGGMTGMLTGVQLQKIFGPTNTKTEEFIKQAKDDSSKQTHAIQLQTKAITNAKGLPTHDTTMQHQLNDLLKVMTEVYGKDGDGKITILLDGQKVSKTINKINSNNDLTGKGKENGESTIGN